MSPRTPNLGRFWQRRPTFSAALVAGIVVTAIAPAALGVPATPAPMALSATITSFGPTVLTPRGTVTTTVEVANMGPGEADGYELSMRLTRNRLITRDAIAAFLDNPEDYRTRAVTARDIQPVPPGSQARVNVSVAAQDLPLPADSWGVYGVSFVLAGPDGPAVIDTAVFTWADAPVPTLPLAIVTTASGGDTRVGALLTAADHPSVTLLIDPVGVSGLGTASASLSGREIYRVPASNPDLASIAHAGDDSLLTYALTQSSSSVPPALRGLPWVAVAAVLDEPTLQLAHDHGAVAAIVEPRFGALLPSVDDRPGGLPSAVADVTLEGSGDTVALIVPDAGLSDLLAHYRPQHPTAPARLVAETALIAAQGDGTQAVIAATGSSWVVDSTQASPVIAALSEAPWITPVSLAAVLSDNRRSSSSLEGAHASASDLSASSIETLAMQLERLQHLAATTEGSDAFLESPGAAVLSAVSLDARATQTDRESAAREVIDRLDHTLGAVSITSGSALNLVAATGNVPVTIRNDLDVASTVTVKMTSNSPNINITATPVVTVQPHSDVTVLVPVTAVSSANVTVRLSLRNADGELIGTPRILDIRVRADWGNAATAVFTIALVGLLVAGLVRTVRRGRKDTRTGPGEVAALEDPRPDETTYYG